MRNALCVVLLLALAVPVVAQEEIRINEVTLSGQLTPNVPPEYLSRQLLQFYFSTYIKASNDIVILRCHAHGDTIKKITSTWNKHQAKQSPLILYGYLSNDDHGMVINVIGIAQLKYMK